MVVNCLTPGTIHSVRIRPVGSSAVLLELAETEPGGRDLVEAWRAELWRRRSAGEFAAVDIIPAARTILIDGVADVSGLTGALPGWAPRSGPASVEGDTINIPIRYDGPDLPAVATHWHVTVAELIARHVATEFRVAFCGFTPGFGYLTGLPVDLAVPRLDTPRSRVPAGSVGLADIYCGVYPTASPGGWRLIGRTEVPLFDVTREPPALLAPGTRVRFTEVGS